MLLGNFLDINSDLDWIKYRTQNQHEITYTSDYFCIVLNSLIENFPEAVI